MVSGRQERIKSFKKSVISSKEHLHLPNHPLRVQSSILGSLHNAQKVVEYLRLGGIEGLGLDTIQVPVCIRPRCVLVERVPVRY